MRFIYESEDRNKGFIGFPESPGFKLDPVKKIEFELADDMTLDDVIENVQRFLESVGYIFPAGTQLGYEDSLDVNSGVGD